MEISWHPWQNSSDIRSHTAEGRLWQFYRVMIARVERTSTYLASRGVETRLSEVWIGSCRGNSGQAPQRAEQRAGDNEAEVWYLSTEDGLARVQQEWSHLSQSPRVSKALKISRVG